MFAVAKSPSVRVSLRQGHRVAQFSRGLTNLAESSSAPISEGTPLSSSSPNPKTHYKITLTRSAIGLPERFKATLESLGIHRRMQTVYMAHGGVAAGKILRLKELVEVENVSADEVKTKQEQRQERKARRGYVVVQSMGA